MNSKLQIIGLGGTNGAGKDTVGEIIAEKYDYLFVSVSDLLRIELRRQNKLVERENMRTLSAQWRQELGLGMLVDKAMALYDAKKDSYEGIVMASLRNPAEADRIHELGGTMVWVDADPHVRYDRIQLNAENRGRPEEDNKTYEQFLEEEAVEMQPGGHAAALHGSAVKEKCDIFIMNDYESLEALQAAVALIYR